MDEKSIAINFPDVSPDIPQPDESTCSVCGRELTAYGSKKLKDGMLCRYCRKKVSEWFGDEILAEMTAEDIAAHIEYRNKNREALEDFAPVYAAGGKYKLYADAANDAFLISRKRDFVSANADLLKLSAIKQVRVYSLVDQVQGTDSDPADLQDTDTDSAGTVQSFGDIIMDIDMEEGEITHLGFRVNEFPGLETDSEEFNKAKNDALDMTELLKDSGVDEERIVFEYGE